MTKQILVFLFCFIRELNPYSPLTLSLYPSIHPYPLTFSLILRPNSKPHPSHPKNASVNVCVCVHISLSLSVHRCGQTIDR